MIKIINDPEIKIEASKTSDPAIESAVADIISAVRQRGDAALYEYSERFDKAKLTALEVTPQELREAYSSVSPEFIGVLERAAENIRHFHAAQLRQGFALADRDGIVLGQKVMPLERVGLYIPGGTAAYPSTVLMNCIPAKIAGVKEIVMVSPPTGGTINAAVLAAAKIAGVDRIFKVGGAQAVAALAYGTESIPRVDKIVGPGNSYVAEAKRQVFGQVAIDMIAGPSEIFIVADEHSDPVQLAADMLSQAEHDRSAAAMLATTTVELANAVSAELERQLALLPRQEIARAAIDGRSFIKVAASVEEAIEFANSIAPEHLELCLDDPFIWLSKVKNAGSVFLGRNCPEALGDYYAGPNHTLPTSGTARFSSPLSVDDFIKKTQFIYYSDDAIAASIDDIAAFARQEGLEAHARSAESRR